MEGSPTQFKPAVKEGWLTKKGGGTSVLGRTNWKRRWFVLQGDVLRYFASDVDAKTGGDNAALGEIVLSACNSVKASTQTTKNWAFELNLLNRSFLVHADSDIDRISWLRVLNNVKEKSNSEVGAVVDASAGASQYANAEALLSQDGRGGGLTYERVSDVMYESLSSDSPLIGLKETPLIGFKAALAEAAAATRTDLSVTMNNGFQFAVELGENTRGLKVDEVAAINVYTQDKPEAFYAGLNAAMGGYTSKKHKDLPAYLPFIRLLLTAMFKLEHIEALVWCGKMGTLAQLIQKKNVGDELTWWSFTSTSLSSDISMGFISYNHDKPEWPLPRVIFRIKLTQGVQIAAFSDFGGGGNGGENEQEVIILPGTTFVIDAIIELGDLLTEVRMHEIVTGGGGIEAALSNRRPAAETVGRRRLPAVPGGDSKIAQVYALAGVDDIIYEEVEYGEVLLAPSDGITVGAHAAALCGAAGISMEVDTQGRTPLYWAARGGLIEIVEALVAAGFDVNKSRTDSAKGAGPLFTAAHKGHAEVVKVLLAANATIDQSQLSDGATPLCISSQIGHVEVVEVLLANKAKIDQQLTSKCTTPLFMAAENGHLEVVTALVAAGAQVDLSRTDGCSPLWIASQNGHKAVVMTLIEAGADVNRSTTDDGKCPLYAASSHGCVDVVAALLKACAMVNKRLKIDGATSLYVASARGHVKVVELLLAAGAAVDLQQTAKGSTPLFIAALSGHTKVVKALLAVKADVHIVSKSGSTALSKAKQSGHIDIVEILSQS